MIIKMPDTQTSAIARKIEELHQKRGEAGNDRVLTLIISTDEKELENALKIANFAGREHPCRVIAIVPETRETTCPAPQPGDATAQPEACIDVDPGTDETDLDAQVRFGADAGAGEVIILRPRHGLCQHTDTLVMPLLVPDAPVVTWWPTNPPANPSKDPLGAMAGSRITDALRADDPKGTFAKLRSNWSPKDVDFSWTRVTTWRAMLATTVDQPPHLPIESVKVTGQPNYLPMKLLAAWLALKLNVPVELGYVTGAEAITGVYLKRSDGTIAMERPDSREAVISQPGQAPQRVAMPLRSLEDCLSEELRRIDPDEVYADVITRGWDLLG
ncbi:glucose-6-phosphate dehydrogenase assembly protein OpcA [Bifidobacterium sp. ESL0763]|uniref:glucose-6-phosphate dehydrogenase assembly protein OpcA n=1 Tax=Bifidobacterium sp. ESL0763 TaxID=2983227 RepID=UPI0023F7C388|nr:glucose-6-phosphate dehydrogenase assembly protein OpcA [Bifidobacterium sp. ESL0763]MDF7664482.1 glucose-6-phosphate dehydrogenase assembly protein OpcA [Bifidobacterium sp. ESL0763]